MENLTELKNKIRHIIDCSPWDTAIEITHPHSLTAKEYDDLTKIADNTVMTCNDDDITKAIQKAGSDMTAEAILTIIAESKNPELWEYVTPVFYLL